MQDQALAAGLGRRWLTAVAVASAIFVVITFFSFAFQDVRPLSRVLFWIGLAGENNVGAWWSGMLLLLAAVFAFDGTLRKDTRIEARRGWAALAAFLLILSFDELASLHEYLAGLGREYLAVLAVPLLVIGCYALWQLYRGNIHRRSLMQIVAAYALLGTVPIQEYIQHNTEWPNLVVYGLRAAIEEGTEIGALLLILAAAYRNTRTLFATGKNTFFGLANHRGVILAVSAALLPVLVAATFVLPYPGGPADWLAAALLFACALLVLRGILRSRSAAAGHATIALLAWYLAASIGANAMDLDWDPVVLGTPIGLRGLFWSALLLAAVPVLMRAGRRANPLWLAGASAAALAASFWPEAQLLWCAFPPLVALGFYALESKAAAGQARVIEHGGMPAASGATKA